MALAKNNLRKTLIFRTLHFKIKLSAMKRSLKIVLTISLLILAQAFTFATGTLYVYYDAACMDRLEYNNQADPSGRKYVVYQVNTPNSDKIVLTVGSENPNPVAQMPAQTLHCGNTIFDQRLVQAINQQNTEVLMVRASGDGRFFISKVAFASYFSFRGGELMYQSPRFQFAFQTLMGVIGENISLNKSSSVVQFEGRMDNACTGEYIFSMSGLSGAGPYSNLVIVPEIGIVEERSGANADEAMRNILRLETVNNRPVADYLRMVCRGERPVPVASGSLPASGETLVARTPGPTPAETVVPVQPGVPAGAVNLMTAATPSTPAKDPCAEVSGNGFHIVQRGENLYRISQKYGVGVGQLREWNSLNAANTIYPCQKLRVAAPAMDVQAAPATYTSPERFTARSVQEVPAWKAYTGTHTVQAGETLASIAMRYGYSEYRFRYFNNLGPNDVAKVGQVLKTTDCECPPQSLIESRPATETVPAPYENVFTPRTPAIGGDVPAATAGGRIRTTSIGNTASVTETELTSNAWRSAAVSYDAVPAGYGADAVRSTGGQVSSGLANRMAGNSSYGAAATVPQSYESGTIRRSTHLVGENETLFDIARRYDTTTENLRRLNNLNPGEGIIPGQRLFVN